MSTTATIIEGAYLWHPTHRIAKTVADRGDGVLALTTFCTICMVSDSDHKRQRELCVNMKQEQFTLHEPRKMPWLLRKLGCSEYSRKGARFCWGAFYPTWGIALALDSYEEGYSLNIAPIFTNWYIKLPRWLPHKEPKDVYTSWGFSSRWGAEWRGTISLDWGDDHIYSIEPLKFLKYGYFHGEVLLKDGTWAEDSGNPELRYTEVLPFRYCTRNFEVQTVQATIKVSRSHFRRKLFAWWPRFNKARTFIDIEFDNQVGEGWNSHKGGVLACSYEMKDCESPRETLFRMERDRRFT